MPIYEFYCTECNTLLSFLSLKIDTATRPNCPHCRSTGLERRPARFATPKQRGDQDQDGFDGLGDFDEERMGGIMESMMSELGNGEGEDDPKKLASLFRRFGKEAGLEAGPQMEEILARMEAGEDPEQLEEDMGSTFDEDGSMDELFRFKKGLREIQRQRPNVDETIYFL